MFGIAIGNTIDPNGGIAVGGAVAGVVLEYLKQLCHVVYVKSENQMKRRYTDVAVMSCIIDHITGPLALLTAQTVGMRNQRACLL